MRKLRAMGVDTSQRSSGPKVDLVMISDPDELLEDAGCQGEKGLRGHSTRPATLRLAAWYVRQVSSGERRPTRALK
jgi:hypothetical protein